MRPWLLTPIEGNPEPGSPEAEYNRHHKQARCTIERCNGDLKMRFRCLFKHRVLHYTPEKAAQIIKACTVLHNMCIEHNVDNPQPQEDEHFDFGMYNNNNFQNIGNNNGAMDRVNPGLAEGRRMRARVMNHFRHR